MSGMTITEVKIVGMCSKCRKEGEEISKDIRGRIYEDNELRMRYKIKLINGEIITFYNKMDEVMVVLNEIFKNKVYTVNSDLYIVTNNIVTVEVGETK